MLNINSKIETIPRVNEKYTAALKRLGIKTVKDFIFHFPFRYEDYSERVPISELAVGQSATVMGVVTKSKLIRTWKKKMLIVECHINDDTGSVRAVWFNQPYISDSLIEGKGVRISGKVSQDKNGLFLSNPAWELSSREATNTGRLVPIYPETEGITSKWIRWQLATVFKSEFEIPDPIPTEILQELHLPSIQTALKYIHFPQTENQYLLAQKKFAFQNMLIVQLASLRIKQQWQKESAVRIAHDKKAIDEFLKTLPFSLTGAQTKAGQEILNDLAKPKPMNRLLNGDVGSGKTIVAAIAALSAANANYQVAIMAPTEVLAKQHYTTLCGLFKNSELKIALLSNSYREINNFQFPISNFQPASSADGSNPNFQNSKLKIDSKFKIQNSLAGQAKLETEKNIRLTREQLLYEIKSGNVSIVVGTHALIQKGVGFKNLALIIVDEQHRFGVDQRAYLQQKAEEINDGIKNMVPHFLTMTATPIPRTLALAFFGNLDLSLLAEMPKNRKPINTKIISPKQRKETYAFVEQEIASGRQAFIIFPLVEESEKLTELKAATQEHKRLSRDIFPNLSLGLLHGKLKSNEKETVMEKFKNKEYDILVATSVVEVGIDVPNATVIIIEDADRFSLSQLHQFRGRVGRGQFQSYCFLFTSSNTAKTKTRLKALEKSNSGFDIAEEDLKLRGPGEFLGTRQSGLPDIAMQHIANVKLIEISKNWAQKLLTSNPTLSKYPLLKKELAKFNTTVHLE